MVAELLHSYTISTATPLPNSGVRISFNHDKRDTMNTLRSSLLTGLVFASTLFAGAVHAADTHDAAWYGVAAPDHVAQRKIEIKADTRWVNVTNGETVTFVADGQRFTFHFQTYPSTQVVDLSTLAPAGVSVKPVRVYVAESPENRG